MHFSQPKLVHQHAFTTLVQLHKDAFTLNILRGAIWALDWAIFSMQFRHFDRFLKSLAILGMPNFLWCKILIPLLQIFKLLGKSHCCIWPNIEEIILSSGHTEMQLSSAHRSSKRTSYERVFNGMAFGLHQL